MTSGGKAGESEPHRRATDLVLVSLLAAGVLIRLWLILGVQSFNEDALITLRYARNLTAGNGWVFNTGEQVLGTTSPLWTMITAVVSAPFGAGNARIVLSLLCLLCYVAASWLLVSRLRSNPDVGPVGPVVLASVLAFHGLLLSPSVGGMEESLFLLLAVVAVLAVERSTFVGFALVGLATLARPEGLVLFLALFSILLLFDRRWRAIAQAVSGFLVVLLPWIMFATIYFGSAVPQSAKAKSGWYGEHISLLSALWRPRELLDLVTELTALRIAAVPTAVQYLVTLAGVVMFALGLRNCLQRRDRVMTTFAVFFIGYVAFFYFGRGILFPWYLLPSSVAFWAVVAVGVDELIGARPRIMKMVAVGGFVVLCMAQLIVRVPEIVRLQHFETDVRQATGEWLSRCTHPNATVMLEPLGYVGYYADRQVIDLAGLVSPDFVALNSSTSPGWPAQEIQRRHPDYLVLRRYEVARNEFLSAGNKPIFADDDARRAFEATYKPVASFSDDFATSSGRDISLVVYARDGISLCR